MRIGRTTELLLIYIFLLSSPLSLGSSKRLSLISEAKLVKLLNSESVPGKQVQSELLGQSFQSLKSINQFDPKLQYQGTHTDTKEKAISNFIPLFGPTQSHSIGVVQKTQSGFSYGAKIYTQQQSSTNGSITDATTTGLSLNMEFDLWKDLFGHLSKAKIKDANLSIQKAKLEARLSLKNQEIEIRKLYWALVANQESLKIAENLRSTASKQLQEAIRREKSSLSDKGEVAKYRAQLSQRESTINTLKYQKAILHKTLKAQFPSLQRGQLDLEPYDLNKTIGEVFACTAKIKSIKETPWEHTPIDELLTVLEQSYQSKIHQQDRYADLDIKLLSEIRMTGVDNTYADSIEDFQSSGGHGYSLGLQISLPIGEATQLTEKTALDYENKRFLALKERYRLQVESEHQQISPMIDLLENAAKSQKASSESLKASLESMTKKYRQARIDINHLINDQDTLLQSLLQEVDTQLATIHNLLDYFKTFPETPCAINNVN